MSARLAAVFLVALSARAVAQNGPPPVLTGIQPPGATLGREQTWTLTGGGLDRVTLVRVEGPGVRVLEWKPKDAASATARVQVDAEATPGFREVRLEGPDGLSNLVMVRLDTLAQVDEVEPNDDRGKAQEVAVGTAVVGVLKPQDLDHFRVKGAPGQRVTVDLEAVRLGTPVAAVVTALSETGLPVSHAREPRGGGRDVRLAVTIPREGSRLIQLRDNLYRGDDQAVYRLRIDPAPFATACFPLGGPSGTAVEVEVSGGSLVEPRFKTVRIPDEPGATVEVGPVDTPFGPILAPGRLMAGAGPEQVEPAGEHEPIEVAQGTTINGRVGRAGEVDVYRVRVQAGQAIRARVEAAALGSWLDSVVTIRDASGATLAENDDSNEAIRPDQARAFGPSGVPAESPDSSVELVPQADGLVTVEVGDRYGDGGPEFGYRLTIGPSRPDFSVALLLGSADNDNAEALKNLIESKGGRANPGIFGVFNLRPGTSAFLNLVVAPQGRPGPVEIRVEGLPPGVEVEPIRVRFPGGSRSNARRSSEAVADLLVMKVAPDADPWSGEFRVVATARPQEGPALTRVATGAVTFERVDFDPNPRPLARVVSSLPLRIVGKPRYRFVGPPGPLRLKGVTVPGPLLQGDQLDLVVDFDRRPEPDELDDLAVITEGEGVVARARPSKGDDETRPDLVVRVVAAPTAAVGVYPVRIAFASKGQPVDTREVKVELRRPVQVKPKAGTIAIRPGDTVPWPVELAREPGFEGEVELRLEGFPEGVSAAVVTLGVGVSKGEFKVMMAAGAKPLTVASAVRVVGVARISGSAVGLESEIRPMIGPRTADKGEEGPGRPGIPGPATPPVENRPQRDE
jgi:hypothetical protein